MNGKGEFNWINGINYNGEFYKGIFHELNTLKFNAINDLEQKQKNLSIFNVILGKAGCPRQIDPIKMSRGIFSLNLEFLQYLFDFLYKTFGTRY